jgi:hydrogenase maturation protease
MIGCRIIGVGQPLAGDDGVGAAVIDHLRASELPPGIELAAVREPSALIPMVDAPTPLVIVDAVLAEPPGQLLEMTPEKLAGGGFASASSHGLGVSDALALAAAARDPDQPAPLVRIVAVSIASAARGELGLSPPVAEAVPRAAALAMARALQFMRPGGT